MFGPKLLDLVSLGDPVVSPLLHKLSPFLPHARTDVNLSSPVLNGNWSVATYTSDSKVPTVVTEEIKHKIEEYLQTMEVVLPVVVEWKVVSSIRNMTGVDILTLAPGDDVLVSASACPDLKIGDNTGWCYGRIQTIRSLLFFEGAERREGLILVMSWYNVERQEGLELMEKHSAAAVVSATDLIGFTTTRFVQQQVLVFSPFADHDEALMASSPKLVVYTKQQGFKPSNKKQLFV